MNPANPFYVAGQEAAAKVMTENIGHKAEGVGLEVVVPVTDVETIHSIQSFAAGVHSVGRGISIVIR